MEKKIILVFGATGHQGGAVVKALLRSDFAIRAVTRNPDQTKSKALAAQGVELVKADYADVESLKQALDGVYGVYSVHNMAGGLKAEEEQGKMLATLAKEAGVRHFVYSSVGGAERHSGIGHFDSKWRVEEHIRSIGLPHTIIRPAFFMENFTMFPPFMMFSILRGCLKNRGLQMVAVEDIGRWVALAFSAPEKYLGKAIEIAGDELTYDEIQSVWEKFKGKRQFCLRLPEFLISMMGEGGTMFLWFGTHGYKADINACKDQAGSMLTFNQWLSEVK
jgi:uncharacterized protein YbjT (DUF2867 family)